MNFIHRFTRGPNGVVICEQVHFADMSESEIALLPDMDEKHYRTISIGPKKPAKKPKRK